MSRQAGENRQRTALRSEVSKHGLSLRKLLGRLLGLAALLPLSLLRQRQHASGKCRVRLCSVQLANDCGPEQP